MNSFVQFLAILLISLFACQLSQAAPAPSNQISEESSFFTSVSVFDGQENIVIEDVHFTDKGRYYLSYSWKNSDKSETLTRSPDGLQFSVRISDHAEVIK